MTPVAQLAIVLVSLAFPVNSVVAQPHVIKLATTTSTENSGLLSELLRPFEQATGYRVHVIAVGTGKALRMGKDGDADVLLVHAYDAEQAFVKEGHGVNRRDVMYNDFVILGPLSDLAKIGGMRDALKGVAQIALSEELFLSRGDNSGTHKKELSLWNAAGLQPAGDWYREAGQGMGKVLQMASELGAYTLADRGTWLAYQDKGLDLQLLVEGDPRLYNPYGIIAVNPAKYRDINYGGAMSLIAWVTSVEGQRIINEFRIGGETLFNPLAVTGEEAGG
jgi:tungstate transport system substrate-binding protein